MKQAQVSLRGYLLIKSMLQLVQNHFQEYVYSKEFIIYYPVATTRESRIGQGLSAKKFIHCLEEASTFACCVKVNTVSIRTMSKA